MKKQLLLSAAVCALAVATSVAVTPAMAGPPPPPAPIWTWTGFYAGGNVGYSWGQGAPTYNEPAFAGTLPTTLTGANNLNGPIGGFQIGYNWQLNNSWVTGLETDFDLANEQNSRSFGPFTESEGAISATLGSKIEWFGTVRGRLGWLWNPTTMVYATGGLAYGRVNVSGSFADTFCSPTCMWGFNQSPTNVGWTVGGGIEGTLPNWIPNVANWTWKIEYLYIDLGSVSGSGFDTDFVGPYTYSANFTDNILRFGLNWHFH